MSLVTSAEEEAVSELGTMAPEEKCGHSHRTDSGFGGPNVPWGLKANRTASVCGEEAGAGPHPVGARPGGPGCLG